MFDFFPSKKEKKRKERKPQHIECPNFGCAGVFQSLQRKDRHDENMVVERSWVKMRLNSRPTLGQYKPEALEFQHEKLGYS